MAIDIRLDHVLLDYRMTLTQLADRVGITVANLSILKTGKARDVRRQFSMRSAESSTANPATLPTSRTTRRPEGHPRREGGQPRENRSRSSP